MSLIDSCTALKALIHDSWARASADLAEVFNMIDWVVEHSLAGSMVLCEAWGATHSLTMQPERPSVLSLGTRTQLSMARLLTFLAAPLDSNYIRDGATTPSETKSLLLLDATRYLPKSYISQSSTALLVCAHHADGLPSCTYSWTF